MKKITAFFLVMMSVITIFGQENEKELKTPKYYEGCCGTKPVEFNLGNSIIFIPNVFTPNGDGLNDYFMPHISDDIVEVQGFTIMSAEGDTVLFNRLSFAYDEIEDSGWNGTRTTSNGLYISDYVGRFKYGMRVVKKGGYLKIIEGEACVIRCGPEAIYFKNNDDCFFSEHALGVYGKANKNDKDIFKEKGKERKKDKDNGNVDKTKKTKEKDCF